jgi:hypothetical protein
MENPGQERKDATTAVNTTTTQKTIIKCPGF